MKDALVTLQQRDGLTDTEMALRLGCSRPYWNMIRHGKRTFPSDMAVRAAGVWPELTRHLLDMAEDSVRSVANSTRDTAGEGM
jgi:plasmid maintenance system antidote protein VapI